MANFEREETVVCSITVKSAGSLKNPATSMKITIKDPAGTAVVNGTTMTLDSTGAYHSDYTSTASSVKGRYEVLYVADDSSRITRHRDHFFITK